MGYEPKPTGSFEYADSNNDHIEIYAKDLKITANRELLLKNPSKHDTLEYLWQYIADTLDGKLIWDVTVCLEEGGVGHRWVEVELNTDTNQKNKVMNQPT